MSECGWNFFSSSISTEDKIEGREEEIHSEYCEYIFLGDDFMIFHHTFLCVFTLASFFNDTQYFHSANQYSKAVWIYAFSIRGWQSHFYIHTKRVQLTFLYIYSNLKDKHNDKETVLLWTCKPTRAATHTHIYSMHILSFERNSIWEFLWHKIIFKWNPRFKSGKFKCIQISVDVQLPYNVCVGLVSHNNDDSRCRSSREIGNTVTVAGPLLSHQHIRISM